MPAKNNHGRLLLPLGLALAVIAAGGWLLFRNLQGTALVKAAGRDTAVDAITGSVTVHADGGIRDLKSEAAGKVVATNIKPGTHFKKGDVLVRLDTTDLDRQIAETKRAFEAAKERAKIQLENNPERKLAADRLDNVKRYFSLGTASEEEVRSAERALADVETRLKLRDFDEKKAETDHKVAMDGLNLLLEKMSVRAPFDGTVEGALTWEGALIATGQPVAQIFSRLRVVAAKIGEESFGRVKVGQPARVRLLTYGEQNYEAAVSELLPTADEAQRFTVYLDVKLEPELLKPGSTGEVTITVDQRPNQVMVPRRALFDSNKIFVVKNGRVELREVEVGYLALNIVEIRKGIDVGEQVIVDELERFRAGQRVRVDVVN